MYYASLFCTSYGSCICSSHLKWAAYLSWSNTLLCIIGYHHSNSFNFKRVLVESFRVCPKRLVMQSVNTSPGQTLRLVAVFHWGCHNSNYPCPTCRDDIEPKWGQRMPVQSWSNTKVLSCVSPFRGVSQSLVPLAGTTLRQRGTEAENTSPIMSELHRGCYSSNYPCPTCRDDIRPKWGQRMPVLSWSDTKALSCVSQGMSQ